MNQVKAEENRLQIEQLNCQLNLCNLETIDREKSDNEIMVIHYLFCLGRE